MKISHKEKQEQEVEIVDDIICNQCGNSLKTNCGYEGLCEAFISGGYYSKLGDGYDYTFSLCENCLKVMFAGFKIPADEYFNQ